MKREKKIEVRVSLTELMQIKNYFKDKNISDYIRTHLLEISKECKIDTSNEKDLYELFKSFLNDDNVAKDIFIKFAKENNLGGFESMRDDNCDEELVFYNGEYIPRDELLKIEAEYRKNNG